MAGIKGRGGPKPTPTPILELRNSRMVKRRVDEPTPEPALPPCPAYLEAPAQLTRARLRLVWQLLSDVGDQAEMLPALARPHVGKALAELVEAKAHVEDASA